MNANLNDFKKLALSGSVLEQDKESAFRVCDSKRKGVNGNDVVEQSDPSRSDGGEDDGSSQVFISAQDGALDGLGEQGVSPLHGFKEPRHRVQQEQYDHRIIAELRAQGKTLTEIAEITGYSGPRIGYIVKQPWCVKYVMERIHANGGRMIQDFLQSHAMKAAETVVDAMDEGFEDRRDRVAAANSLLDRVFGKATQTVIQHKGSDLNKLSDDELAVIAQQSAGN